MIARAWTKTDRPCESRPVSFPFKEQFMNTRTLRLFMLVLPVVLAGACGRATSPTAPSAAALASGTADASASSQASEQLVFSGVVFGAQVENVTTPIGYWIWCTAENAGPSQGHNLAAATCAGSMRFDALNLTKAISGTVSEPQEGIYEIAAKSSDGKVNCTLRNASADLVSGPHNTVLVACTAPDGGGTSVNGVVNVTGHD
jgi:hypothetical protein